VDSNAARDVVALNAREQRSGDAATSASISARPCAEESYQGETDELDDQFRCVEGEGEKEEGSE
jgi:hypothetical protein